MNIPKVYEDDWLLIVDKPSGLLTVPTPKKEARTLTSILNADLEERKIEYKLHPCHRLDRDTSGLIVYAKGKSTQQKMMDLFRERLVTKKYIAFVNGALKSPSGRIDSPIEGGFAVTDYKVVNRLNNFTVVEVSPLTGRTNQIRIHFKRIGHPVLGETKYAFRKDFKIKAKRLCLHAKEITFRHPVSQKSLRISIDLPEDLGRILKEQQHA